MTGVGHNELEGATMVRQGNSCQWYYTGRWWSTSVQTFPIISFKKLTVGSVTAEPRNLFQYSMILISLAMAVTWWAFTLIDTSRIYLNVSLLRLHTHYNLVSFMWTPSVSLADAISMDRKRGWAWEQSENLSQDLKNKRNSLGILVTSCDG